jgi:predicted dehydrogenase
LHYDWHWIWETGNGDFGNQGVHQVDIARWFMGEDGLPPSALSMFGGRFGYEDDGETPNSQLVVFQYEKAPLYFEVRGLPTATGAKEMDTYLGSGVGVVLQYEKGRVLIPNYSAVIAFDPQGAVLKRWGRYTLPGEAPEPKPAAAGPAPAPQADSHHSNFIHAVRSGKAADLNCNVREGELSSALCHLAGISHRLGAQWAPDAIGERVKSDAHAVESLGRMGEHLKRNDALPEKATFGVPLKIDTTKELIVGNPAASELARRRDRAPFQVPELV